MINKYELKSLEKYKLWDWHLGYKYFVANYRDRKIFIKLNGMHNSAVIESKIIERLRCNEFFPELEFYEGGQFESIAITFIEGQTLNKLLKNRTLNQLQIKSICNQLIQALEVMKNNNIVHRDLRPHNIIIDLLSEDTVCVKIIDFGFSIASFDNKGFEDVLINDKPRLDGLGGEYRYNHLIWDDAYSISLVFKEMDMDFERNYPEIWSRIVQQIGKNRYSLA